ncbi:Lrp/AsnC family transcriptional regulator [Paracoccus denitrificans]|uniref:Transcriptional regulator, AsnC family n=1 Tax=Paracoccus denitrificans (strain Pd 1222) TaxID=318586 RepID=A1BB11_PARDP|nr:Lrp/AsnC family transcriptional regulator [Paracoccus denitrificans]ABL72705.1 transcriptional regulator, AsnC family [Paracoccus denitrificans PD1222]MBB4629276.1 Lrp/AsnC family transcriptional regulator [Paracoccus denitrificans]MCU7430295.1 Lrp/AsnC family transcriptional regulator [Paracoccus denitrificans]QAR29674.1 Lrp/AsnC family transcriptional regulator [Paracoccus denitrificans]UPV98552.1 Lrp/AsnC family transcriptional regulator [Paracoccus denitrificans]
MRDADLLILKLLQEDCSLSLEAISARVNMSITSCHRRIKALEARGVIKGRRVTLDPEKLGFQVTGIFLIKLGQDVFDVDRRLAKILERESAVVASYLVAGEFDFVLIAKFRTAAEYTDYIYSFLETYADIRIQSYTSQLVVRTLRETAALPL